MKTIEEIILEFVIEQFGNDKPTEKRLQHYSYCKFPEEECTCKNLLKIDYDTSLIHGGYIDSFSMFIVLVFLEKTFNIKISEKDAIPENFDTVNKMTQLINKLKT